MTEIIRTNILYYGDNLDILKRYIKDETVDLIYLDPPFNSNEKYNVIYKGVDGQECESQVQAFDDTWHWCEDSEKYYREIVTRGDKLSEIIQSFRGFLHETNTMSYILMMAPRLCELHRVLKSTGSIYLHCDPTASHYLKLLMDAIFGIDNFKNEVVWHYNTWMVHLKHHINRKHDIILFYSKTKNNFFIHPTRPWKNKEEYTCNLGPIYTDDSGKEYYLHENNKMVYIEKNLLEGKLLDDVWDIPALTSSDRERLGYPTQKPVSLLERIIKTSCPPDGIILDPFCGCGTSISAAQKLGYNWIGIDITQLAITVIKKRLIDSFGQNASYEMVGEPHSLQDAMVLAKENPYQFQWWSLGLIGARPVEQKKGSDKGIDGKILFFEHEKQSEPKQIIISVKAGGVTVNQVRDLRGVIERDNAAIGIFISLEQPTKPMITESIMAGVYIFNGVEKIEYPKIQLITIEDLFNGKKIQVPPYVHTLGNVTYKKAQKIAEKPPTKQWTILEDF